MASREVPVCRRTREDLKVLGQEECSRCKEHWVDHWTNEEKREEAAAKREEAAARRAQEEARLRIEQEEAAARRARLRIEQEEAAARRAQQESRLEETRLKIEEAKAVTIAAEADLLTRKRQSAETGKESVSV